MTKNHKGNDIYNQLKTFMDKNYEDYEEAFLTDHIHHDERLETAYNMGINDFLTEAENSCLEQLLTHENEDLRRLGRLIQKLLLQEKTL